MRYPKIMMMMSLTVFAYGCTDDTDTSTADASMAVGPDMAGLDADSGLQFIDAGRPVNRMDSGSLDMETGLQSACLETPPPPSQPAINLQARCRRGGEPIRIRDLRDRRCPDWVDFRDGDGDGFSDMREDVELSEVVVTAVYGDDFAVQDLDGGAYSGLWVFSRDRRLDPDVRPGTRIRLWGSMFEYYTLTEIQLTPESGGLEIIGQAGEPLPLLISDPARIADGGDLTEALESVLVEIQNVPVRSTAPDCPRDFDMFVVEGGLRVEDEVELEYEPARGDFIERVVGVLHFSFETQKIRPRSDADISVIHCNGIPDKCEASECVAELGDVESGELVISEIQDDPRGRDVGREYVELYNPTDRSISLNGWWLQNCADHRVDLQGRVQPGDYFVIAGARDRNTNGGINAQAELGDLQLSNGSGSLLLFTDTGVLVDQVRYDDAAPWPRRETGQSLELTALGGDNSNGATWRAARGEYGAGGEGSPGRR
ncbi:MAG: hypothetical protein CMH52_12970 [Myxococcales bacterium]|nr:hypothetical protein [Myxococcales bacterium]